MSNKWHAVDHEFKLYFGAPASFGYNKNDHLHNPENPFAHMFMYIKLNDPCSNYELIDDYPPSSYTDLTESIYNEYKTFCSIGESDDERIIHNKGE